MSTTRRTAGSDSKGRLRFICWAREDYLISDTLARLRAAKADQTGTVEPELRAFQEAVARNAPPRMELDDE